MLREKWIRRENIGIEEYENYTNFILFDNDRLQIIADFVVNKVSSQINLPSVEKIECEYIGGQIINLPKWYLLCKGHDLEYALKCVFPELKRFRKESELKMEIIKKVIDDIPSLVSKDFLDLFDEIQKI